MKNGGIKLTLFLVSFFCISQSILANPISPRWHRLEDAGPSRKLLGCAYDSGRDVVVLFGGMDSISVRSDEVWEWSGDWRQIQAEGPQSRIGLGMCYDTLHHVTLMFGGRFEDGPYADDLWSWDGTSWTHINATGPSARGFFTFEYDPVRLKAVLFGGCDGHTLFGETWEWDGFNWTLAHTDGPPQRVMAAMAFDYSNDKMILFGGCPTFDEGFLGDTWELDESGWTEVICENSPSPRLGHSMTSESLIGEIILFGGCDSELGPLPTETWHFDDSNWYTVGLDDNPEPRYWAGMVYRSSNGTSLLSGGLNHGDLWVFPFHVLDYVIGDINDDGRFSGVDIIYGVNFFKGIGPEPPRFAENCADGLYVAGDVNGNCTFNGIDITFAVNYLKGRVPALVPCPICPPISH